MRSVLFCGSPKRPLPCLALPRGYGRCPGRQGTLDASHRPLALVEEAALSALDSLCRATEHGRFPKLADREGLWRLLMQMTARKAADILRHETCLIRGGGHVRGEKTVSAAGTECRVWDMPRQTIMVNARATADVGGLGFSPDRKWLLTSTNESFQFSKSGTWRPARRIPRADPGFFTPRAFSRDGGMLAIASARYVVELLRLPTFEPLTRLEPPTRNRSQGGAMLAAIWPRESPFAPRK
ncbi:MAG: ECF-type sigma factor [Planctomycetes bacterium]|nr:ECF-type sigma factor [Planctomycetota bacterium]